MTQARTPEIRFEGFEGEWQPCTLDKMANRYDSQRVPITSHNRIPGSTPYYGANGIQDYVEGFTHIGEFVLIAEDGANDLANYPVRFVSGEIWVNNHAHVLQGISSVVDNKFLAYRMREINYEEVLVGGGRAKLNAKALMEIVALLPKIEEQQSIGAYFREFDVLLDAESQKLEKLRALKQTMLTKMFPQGDSRVPEIRFEGFEGEWNSRSLAELISIGSGRDYKHLAPGGVPVYGTGGYMTSVDQWLSVEDAIGIGRKGTIDKPYLLSAPFWTVDTLFYATPIKGVDLYFLLALSRTLPWKRYDESTGVPSLSKEAIYAIRVATPIPEEQQAIGAYFREFDVLLDAESQKLEKLRHLKSAFLSSMFV